MKHRMWAITSATLVAATTYSLVLLTSSSSATVSGAEKTIVVNAFGIGDDDLIPAPDTTAGVPSVGDVAILDDQLTSTIEKKGSYPIVGFDSGSCTYSRVAPDGQPAGSRFNSTIEHCSATAVLPRGSLSVQGVVLRTGGMPEDGTLAISGGTGGYVGAKGTVRVAFGREFNTYTFDLK